MTRRGYLPSFADAPIDTPDELGAGSPSPRMRGEVHGERGEVGEPP